MRFSTFDNYFAPLLVLLFAILFLTQYKRPLRLWISPKSRHAILNLAVSIPSAVILRLAIFPIGYSAAVWAKSAHFGVFNLLPLPSSVSYALIFLVMDLSFYYWHVLNHKTLILWRFHNVHHMDLDLDVSTAFRFHFGELLFSIAFRGMQVIMLGVPPALFFIYEGFFQAATEFHHSNLRLPIRLERLLVLIVVTPRMHGIHHSIVQQETDSNFSTIFSFWDRLHSTVRLNIAQKDITIGVPAYQALSHQNLASLLSLPFRAQKEYWMMDDGTKPIREQAEGHPSFLAA
jgi:sterol desaturase/sphingolipid hydroxylase (fatty acid hydroxylase superfamily)